MAQATAAPVSSGAADLRIVLFGLRSAGKSSLLGALAQAAQTQEKYLKGRVIDRSDGRLAALHQRLFEDAPEQTEEEIVLYPLQFIPQTPGSRPQNVVIYDCNGQAASDILLNNQSLEGRRSNLLRALADADTVVLVVDGSDKPAQLERDFVQFATFLRLFEESRAKHSEVGGLPVYLVLTKCDLLAQPTDTPGAWIQKVEEKKRLVATRFQKFLAKQSDPSFGKINLNLWATAIHRPALADRPAKSVEPFGVADLFRQCLQSAMAHSAVRKDAQRRLQYTVFAVAGLVLLMVTLGLAFYLARPPEGLEQLGREAEMWLPAKNADIGERLDAKDTAQKAKRLLEVMKDPKFPELDKDLKQRVTSFLKDYEAYEELKDRYKDVRISPGLIDNAEDLKETQKRLAEFKAPPQFEGSLVGQMKKNLESDLQILDAAVKKQTAWYEQQLALGRPLLDVNIGELSSDAAKRMQWLKKVDEFLSLEPPHPNNDKRLPNAVGITNQTIWGFDTVVRARSELDDFRQRLTDLRRFVDKKRS